MDKKIKRDVKYLKIYAGVLTIALISFLLMSFTSNPKQKFNEIDVQRLNIVSPKGKLRMVISNAKRQSPGMLNGKKFHPRKRPPGMIFFNKQGDEVGGLVYDVKGLVVSVDQYKRDQIMQLQYDESKNGKRKYGLQLWDRNGDMKQFRIWNIMDSLRTLHYSRKKINKTLKKMNGGTPITSRRMFVGKNKKQQVGLFIQDQQGNDRIKLYVNKQNKVQMKIWDKNGKKMSLDQLK